MEEEAHLRDSGAGREMKASGSGGSSDVQEDSEILQGVAGSREC